MGEKNLGRRVLEKIIDKLGGAEAAAQRLQIAPSLLQRFVAGSLDVPDAVLLRAVDCLHEDWTDVARTPPMSVGQDVIIEKIPDD